MCFVVSKLFSLGWVIELLVSPFRLYQYNVYLCKIYLSELRRMLIYIDIIENMYRQN